MIAPGCSFSFDGLKQVMLAVREGIESRLSAVSHLFVNYRTTKDVLQVANKVLQIIRTKFPGTITVSGPEVAKKDLKLKVVLCERSLAFQEKSVRLTANQAIVYSSRNPEETESRLIDWVGSHPLILSSSDSKGLEFDDVILLFDHERKTWQPERQRDATLRMLRELYVAITRAQRQLVILVDKSVPSMLEFFGNLEYDFHQDGADMVLREFDTISSSEEWLKKAASFATNHQFRLAARCFNLAGDKGMSYWSTAKYFESGGDDLKAAESFLSALDVFASNENYEKVLEVCLALASPEMTKHCCWTEERHSFVELALARRPTHLLRSDVVKLSLVSGAWENVQVEDIFNAELASLFISYRENPALKKIVKDASSEDRQKVLHVIPPLIGDLHYDSGDFSGAVAAFLLCHSTRDAVSVTTDVLKRFNADQKQSYKDDILRAITLWETSTKTASYPVSLLLELFRSPEEVGKANFKECMTRLGRSVIIFAIDEKRHDRTSLFEINPTEFYPEVTGQLLAQLKEHVKVVQWFCERSSPSLGLDFAKQHLKKLSITMMRDVAVLCKEAPSWLVMEAYRRDLIAELVLRLMGSDVSFPQKKCYITAITDQDKDLKSLASNGNLALLTWCFGALSGGPKKAKSNHRKNSKAPTTKKVSPQSLIENAQYCGVALASVWPDKKRGAETSIAQDFSDCECVLLLSFLFKCTDQDQSVQKHVATKMTKLHRSARFLAPLLDLVFLYNLEMSVAATITKKAVSEKMGSIGLQKIQTIWARFFESSRSEEPLPRDLFPPLTDLLIATENLGLACHVVSRALSSSNLTKEQRKAAISSCAFKWSSVISYALANRFIEVAVETTGHCLKNGNDVVPLLHEWNAVTAKHSFGSMERAGQDETHSFLFDAKSLVALLTIVSRDIRCMASEAECFHCLLVTFGSTLVAYAYMYTGECDLTSGLYKGLSAFHNELREVLPKLAPQQNQQNAQKSSASPSGPAENGVEKQYQKSSNRKKKSTKTRNIHVGESGESLVQVLNQSEGKASKITSRDAAADAIGLTTGHRETTADIEHTSSSNTAQPNYITTNNKKKKNSKKNRKKNNKKK